MLEYYYNSIPVGRENAVTYPTLCEKWGMSERQVRKKLHELSLWENGDNFVIIRSGHGKGFYKTDDINEIKAYKKEIMAKAKSNFAPLGKINRILNSDTEALQTSIFNNMKVIRLERNLYQQDVVEYMRKFDLSFDTPMLSKFENGFCLPTPYQLMKLAELYECKPSDLIVIDNSVLDIYA